jgi:hypothetical protein
MKNYLASLRLRFLRWQIKNPYLSYKIQGLSLFALAFCAGVIVTIIVIYGLPTENDALWTLAGIGIGMTIGPVFWLSVAVLIHEVEQERLKLSDEWTKRSMEQIAQIEAGYARLDKREREALLRKWTVAGDTDTKAGGE